MRQHKTLDIEKSRELSTIQKREKLNKVLAWDEPGAGGANHAYLIIDDSREIPGHRYYTMAALGFQLGPRNDPESVAGVTDQDLLEIVRDRLRGFQSGELATRETAIALTHVEEALLWLNKRIEDRIERGVLGTMEK